MTRKNPTDAIEKKRVKIVFHVSTAAMTAAGCAAVSGTADAVSEPLKYSPAVRMALDRRHGLLARSSSQQGSPIC